MGKKRKCIVGLVSGMTLAIGTATAGPPTPAVTPALQQNIKVNSVNTQPPSTSPASEIKIKEDAKPGQKLMDNNLGRTTSNQIKTNENTKPVPQTQKPVKVMDDATAGKAYELTRR